MTEEQNYKVFWDFDFGKAQIQDNEGELTPEQIAKELLEGAEAILFLRKFVDERIPIDQFNNLRKRGYIQEGDIVNDPWWMMWPQTRTFRETRKDYKDYKDSLKNTKAYNERWKGSRAIVLVNDNSTPETVRASIERQLKDITFTKDRNSNCYDIFVFENLKNKEGEYRFKGAYKHMYESNEQYVYQDDKMYDRYYFNNGILTMLLYQKGLLNPSEMKTDKYPFISEYCKSSNYQFDDFNKLADKLDKDKGIKNILLQIETEFSSYNKFIEFCNRLKTICEFFCVNIFLVLADANVPKFQGCTKERTKALLRSTNSIDSFIYAK